MAGEQNPFALLEKLQILLQAPVLAQEAVAEDGNILLVALYQNGYAVC